jgi:hypothetical protein
MIFKFDNPNQPVVIIIHYLYVKNIYTFFSYTRIWWRLFIFSFVFVLIFLLMIVTQTTNNVFDINICIHKERRDCDLSMSICIYANTIESMWQQLAIEKNKRKILTMINVHIPMDIVNEFCEWQRLFKSLISTE